MYISHQSLKVIENSKINNSFSHAYLFFGEKGVDVFETAFMAAKMILCNNDKCMLAKTIPELNYHDLIFINPENNLITKESIVSTIKEMTNTALSSNSKKILFIKDVDLGNKYSLNSLLKFMEDPAENTHIIMTTNKIDLLLSTIKSRAQNILVKRQTRKEIIDELLKNKINDDYIGLFANIFSSVEDAKKINLKKFSIFYNDVLSALEIGLMNPNKMKIDLSKIITKENILHVINILEYFFYQIQMIVEDEFPLFPNHLELINKYKSYSMDYSFIQIELSNFKKSFLNRGNFNLQKESFLIKLVKIYER